MWFSRKLSFLKLHWMFSVTLQSQNWPISNHLSILNYLYYITYIIFDKEINERLAAHLFLPLIKKKSLRWIFWFSEHRRHLNTLSVVSGENPSHPHGSHEGKKRKCKYAKFRWSKKVCVLILSFRESVLEVFKKGTEPFISAVLKWGALVTASRKAPVSSLWCKC